MKTLKAPQGAPEPVVPAEPTFPERLVPFAVTCRNDCRAELLVDTPDDLVYLDRYIMYGDDLSFYLSVTCPFCDHINDLESYDEPGTPAAHAPEYRRRWNSNIPISSRSAAYRRWEAAHDRAFWIRFFAKRDMRDWAHAKPRAARKLQARLLQPWNHHDLLAAGVRREVIDLLGADWADAWAGSQQFIEDEADLARSFLLELNADLQRMPFAEARRIAAEHGVIGPGRQTRSTLNAAIRAFIWPQS